MDFDLTEYDQVDEARFFLGQKDQQVGDLLTTFSFEQTKSDDLTNCENDFVFLPAQVITPGTSTRATEAISLVSKKAFNAEAQQVCSSGQGACSDSSRTIITPEQLDIRSHRPINPERCASSEAASAAKRHQDHGLSSHYSQQRVANPLTAIHTNGGNNPFHSLQQTFLDESSLTSATNQSQPFWMRHENFSNKPIGLLEVNIPPTTNQNANHLSDLMHQIITKSDSIYIAIPCVFCHEPKPCPPSDISAWLSHMNRAHNCKVCPICNKLIGLGPIRDIEIMRKHVVSHIDNDWLENKTSKVNFSFGLQNHWFSSGHCSVKDPRSLPKYK